jgi:hypothetical protein
VVCRKVHHNVVVAPTSNDALCSDVSSRIYIVIVTRIELVKNKYKSLETKAITTAAWIRPRTCPFQRLPCILRCLDNVLSSSEDLRARAAMRLNA